LDMSILDHKVICNFLKNKGLLAKANPTFVKLVEGLEKAENPNPSTFDWNSFHDLYGQDEEHYTVGAIFGIGLNKYAAGDRGKIKGILAAVIMIAAGIPVSLALLKTDTTASDLSSHPELIKKGKEIVQMRETSPQISKIVNDLVSKPYAHSPGAGMQVPNLPLSMIEGDTPAVKNKIEEAVGKTYKNTPPPPAAKPGQKQSYEITKPLVDAVISMEHVPNKNYSSAGAGGMMQLMPDTWEALNKRYFGSKYPFRKYNSNDYINRRFGALYLQEIKGL
jgi:hypothetical protein